MENWIPILGGSFGAAMVSGFFGLIMYYINRRQQRASQGEIQNKALRYLMLYIIQERAKQHIREGCIALDDRRSLHHWHALYHDGLGGNGDADTLMRQVDGLPLNTQDL